MAVAVVAVVVVVAQQRLSGPTHTQWLTHLLTHSRMQSNGKSWRSKYAACSSSWPSNETPRPC